MTSSHRSFIKIRLINRPSCRVSSTLTSGFEPTEHKGTVTKVGGDGVTDRTIMEIDNRPARDVYDEWTDGCVLDKLHFDPETHVGNILAQSSWQPLAEPLAENYWRVMHPAFVNEIDGSVQTFGNAHVGMDLTSLTCSPDDMLSHINDSAHQLLTKQAAANPGRAVTRQNCIGALMIFCGGLVMAFDDDMPMAAEELLGIVGHKDNLGICCFGEQGKAGLCHYLCTAAVVAVAAVVICCLEPDVT